MMWRVAVAALCVAALGLAIHNVTTKPYPALAYIFDVSTSRCKFEGLPDYVLHSLAQALLTQGNDSSVYFACNFADCPRAKMQLEARAMVNKHALTAVDSQSILTTRGREFLLCATSSKLFAEESYSNLWLTSSLRFFVLDDLVRKFSLSEVILIESDNMLYARLSYLAASLRAASPQALAVQPLNANKFYLTASFLWVPTAQTLRHLTTFFMRICNNPLLLIDFLEWIRPYAKTQPFAKLSTSSRNSNSRNSDSSRYGVTYRIGNQDWSTSIKPTAVNEMSMLAFYRHKLPKRISLFPVLPRATYVHNTHTCDFNLYVPGGAEVIPPLKAALSDPHAQNLDWIFDPNSWGQLSGGSRGKRRSRFINPEHIVGQAAGTSGCLLKMLCGNSSLYSLGPGRDCYTAPFVSCGPEERWTALVNLHVHSKDMASWSGAPCDCPL